MERATPSDDGRIADEPVVLPEHVVAAPVLLGMPLSPGSKLGHYDVTSLLGEGGMGQVWQATDTQLNRQVALKILPDAFTDDSDRRARFEREARVVTP